MPTPDFTFDANYAPREAIARMVDTYGTATLTAPAYAYPQDYSGRVTYRDGLGREGYVVERPSEGHYYPSSDELTSRAIEGINHADVSWDDIYELSRQNAIASEEAVAAANAYVAAMQSRSHSSGELLAAINSLDAERVGRTLTDQLMMALAAHDPDAKRAALRHLKRAVDTFFDRKIDEMKPDEEEQQSTLYDSLFNDEEIL